MMTDLFIFVLFLLPVVISIVLCFLKDSKKVRGKFLNVLLIINAVVYTFPLIYAYWKTRPDGNMWSENGPGAILWLYFIIIPLCALVLIVLLILKLVFKRKSDDTIK